MLGRECSCLELGADLNDLMKYIPVLGFCGPNGVGIETAENADGEGQRNLFKIAA